jgi:hypothetical protein
MEMIVLERSTKDIQNNNNNSNKEHKRQLLLEILIQRGIVFDSEIGRVVDDKYNIESLLFFYTTLYDSSYSSHINWHFFG